MESSLTGYLRNNNNTSMLDQNTSIGVGTPITVTYPYIYNPFYKYYTSCICPPRAEIEIRKVENGWIVYKNGKEFVVTDKQQIATLID